MLKDKIISVLKEIYDPEISINIWDLGLIYEINEKNNIIEIVMTFTSPMCPMIDEMLAEVKEKISNIDNTKQVNIKLTWEPAWDLSKISDKAKIDLDLINEGW